MQQNQTDPIKVSALPVYNERGASLVLSDLWAEQPAVVVFVRHFG